MKLYVIFGQRKTSYPGEYAPEALDCIDENNESDNPDFLTEKKAFYEASGEFDSLAIVSLEYPGEAIDKALFPSGFPVDATVSSEQGCAF